ncbi:MAG: transcription termination/antitermination protein NusG [Actinomycetota bacterium]|jgi:transcriptional antiterminator NusG|nr:transcription termination/antitermination protein NusG [Actinomycetota bacterium]|tara:strand:- start:304 stop:924 length:621 start_codon:yes stop_codon:yes gene_type:complete
MSEEVLIEEQEENETIEAVSNNQHPYDLAGEWFVLNAQSGHEKKVRTNILTRLKNLHLEDKVYDVVIPTDEVVEIRNGKKVNVEKKTFPGYVLVRMDLDDETWYQIRNTPSVIGFVGSGKMPQSLSRREIERILGSNEEVEVKKESPKFKPDFEVGETVRVTTGPFADFNGIIEEINLDQSKVTVLVNIFGRETPVELGFTDIVKN